LAEVHQSKEFEKSNAKLCRDKRLKDKLEEVKYTMRNDTIEGDQIHKYQIPKKYRTKYGLNNLFRYPIDSYRLLYSIITYEKSQKIYALIDIMTHKEYERLFGYHTS
jgi:hypothetical protein